MILHVTSAKYLHDYQIEVAFNDGRKGIADLSNVLRGILTRYLPFGLLAHNA